MATYQNGFDADRSGLQHIADPASGVSGLQTATQYPNANHYYSPTHQENSYNGTDYSGSSPQTAYSSTLSEPKGGLPPPVAERRICGLGTKLFWIVVALVGVIIVAAAVGGGVGGALAAKNKKEKAAAVATTTGVQAASATTSTSSLHPSSTSR